MNKYWIGIPTDNFGGHLTLKYIGEATPDQIARLKMKLDQLKTVQAFPVKSLGVGILGRRSASFVDFIGSNKRLMAALDQFGMRGKQVPHVTRFRVEPMTTGPVDPMNTTLAKVINLYENTGSSTNVIYSVELSRRTPVTWVMDQLGLSKYAEEQMNKTALHPAVIEGLAGAAVGGLPTLAITQDPRDAGIMAGAGAASFLGLGALARHNRKGFLQNKINSIKAHKESEDKVFAGHLAKAMQDRKDILNATPRDTEALKRTYQDVAFIKKQRRYYGDKWNKVLDKYDKTDLKTPFWKRPKYPKHEKIGSYMHKTAANSAAVLEALLGGAAGFGIGHGRPVKSPQQVVRENPQEFYNKPKNVQRLYTEYENARKQQVGRGFMGAAIGAVGGVGVGHLARKSADKKLLEITKQVADKHQAITDESVGYIDKLRTQRYTEQPSQQAGAKGFLGRNLNYKGPRPAVGRFEYADDVYDAMTPHLNQILARDYGVKKIEAELASAQATAQKVPFGLGGGVAKRRFMKNTEPYTVRYDKSGLNMDEDISKATKFQRKQILDKIFSGKPGMEGTRNSLDWFVDNYRHA